MKRLGVVGLASSLLPFLLALGSGLTPAPARALSETNADTGCPIGDNPDPTTGTGFASSSCAASYEEATESAEASIQVVTGKVSGMAAFSAYGTGTSTAAFGIANAWGTFTDHFTLTATDIFGAPLSGAGTMTADLGCSGTMTSAASSNDFSSASYLIGVLAQVNIGGSIGEAELVRQRSVDGGVVTFNNEVGVPSSCGFSVTVPVTFGASGDITMTLSLAASGAAIGVGEFGVASSSGIAEWGATFQWLGISEVLDPGGDPVGSFTALGDGVDWAGPVPEPSSALLLALGLAGVAAMRR